MKIVTSNFAVDGKNVVTTLNYPFAIIENRPKITSGCAGEDLPATLAFTAAHARSGHRLTKIFL